MKTSCRCSGKKLSGEMEEEVEEINKYIKKAAHCIECLLNFYLFSLCFYASRATLLLNFLFSKHTATTH